MGLSAHLLGNRRAVSLVPDPGNDDIPASNAQEIEGLLVVLGQRRLAQAAREVVDRDRTPSFGVGHLEHKGPVLSAGERIADPLLAAAQPPAVPTVRSRHGIDVPGTGRIVAFRNRDIDGFQLFLVPRIPDVEAKYLVVHTIEQLRINAFVEAAVAHPVDEVPLFVIDNEPMVRTVEDIAAAHRNLRIHLPVAIHRSVKEQHPFLCPRVSTLLAQAMELSRDLPERVLVDRLDHLRARGFDGAGQRHRRHGQDKGNDCGSDGQFHHVFLRFLMERTLAKPLDIDNPKIRHPANALPVLWLFSDVRF